MWTVQDSRLLQVTDYWEKTKLLLTFMPCTLRLDVEEGTRRAALAYLSALEALSTTVNLVERVWSRESGFSSPASQASPLISPHLNGDPQPATLLYFTVRGGEISMVLCSSPSWFINLPNTAGVGGFLPGHCILSVVAAAISARYIGRPGPGEMIFRPESRVQATCC